MCSATGKNVLQRLFSCSQLKGFSGIVPKPWLVSLWIAIFTKLLADQWTFFCSTGIVPVKAMEQPGAVGLAALWIMLLVGRSKRGTRDAWTPLGPNPAFGSQFFQFHEVFGKVWENCMLASPEGWRPTLGKSWIYHWIDFSPKVIILRNLYFC